MNGSRLLYLQGCLLVLLAGTLWSFGGLILRHVREADEWQFLFYRSVGLALVLLLQFRLQRVGSVFGRYRESGGVGIVATLCVAVSAVSFIYSLTHTSVANSLLLTSVSPLLTVALGYWVLGERLDRRTALALLLALAGIAVMVRGDLGRGQWFGNVMALLSALAFAGYSVCLRLGRERDMLPAVLVYALLTALVGAAICLARGRGLALPPTDIALALLHGGLLLGLGTPLYTLGARRVTAVELTILAQTETVLGPLWVWLALGETPAVTTLVGGALVLTAVVGRTLAGLRSAPAAD